MGHLEAELYALDPLSTLGPEHAITANSDGLLGAHYALVPGLAHPDRLRGVCQNVKGAGAMVML